MTSANPIPSPFSQVRRRRGFNLIEAAIVLGVVGLVIGGIWVAASAVQNNIKVRETVNNTIFIAACSQNLFNRMNAPSTNQNITSTLIAAGCIPRDWVLGSITKNAFGGEVQVVSQEGNRIDIYHYNVPRDPCIRIASRLTTIGAQAGSKGLGLSTRTTLGYLSVNSWNTRDFPANLVDLESACNSNSNFMSFTYGYNPY